MKLSGLKNYVITSNRYNLLLEGYMSLFSKFWPTEEVETVIVGFNTPKTKLLDNFTFSSMGEQNGGVSWCDPLIKFFEEVSDDYFLMCFEDHYPIKPLAPVAKLRLEEGLEFLQNNEADKLYLMPDYFGKAKQHFKGNWHLSFDNGGELVTTSLLPSVWRREHLLKLLNKAKSLGAQTPHDFELLLNRSSTEGRVLLTPGTTEEACIYVNLDAVRSGTYNSGIFHRWNQNRSTGPQEWMQNVDEDVMKVFKSMEEKWSGRNV